MTRICSLEIRYEFVDSVLQDRLRHKDNAVVFVMKDPLTLELTVGDVVVHRHKLVLPLDSFRGKGKVARKSSWVEYKAPVMGTKDLNIRSDSVFSASIYAR